MFERPPQVPEGLAADASSTFLKASPALGVGGLSASGVSLEEWVFIATLVYLVLQILYLGYKFVRDLRRDRKEQADG